MEMQSVPSSSSRILYDVPCAVCRDHSSGKHYGVFACDGCAGFFKRSVRRDRRYACKARAPGACLVDKAHRNQCRACRLAKCLDAGMNRDAVQHERGPRTRTRRQLSFIIKQNDISSSSQGSMVFPPPVPRAQPLHPALHATLSHLPISLLPGYLSPAPRLLPLAADPQAICEAAARVLFMNVKWAKTVPAFSSLSLSDRLLLLEESWRDLFLITTAQFLYPLDVKVLCEKSEENGGAEEFERALCGMARVRADGGECACLRALCLFRTDGPRALHDPRAVASLQDAAHLALKEYTMQVHPLDTSRSSQLIQVLPIIRRVSSDTIVGLFFRSTIGQTPIERILSDMYRSSSIGDEI